MKITSKNYNELFIDHFYKATSSGVQTCYLVNNADSRTDESVELVGGYIVDSLFYRIRYGGVNYVPIFADLTHLDSSQQGFFTTEEEAVDFHRQLVINYINGLNASSLKTNPINVS
jgi:hypothetical protein